MGLGQYVYITDKKYCDREQGEAFYWSKHNRLQGWMEDLWRRRGETEVFNCIPLQLTEDDIVELEQAIRSMSLPETKGFFYGVDSYIESVFLGYKTSRDPDDGMTTWERDLAFVEAAKLALAEGKRVYYICSW